MPNVRWRPATAADVPECLMVQREHIGDSVVGEAVAIDIWRNLIPHPGTIAAVFESDYQRARSRIVGFGLTAFVQRAFADAELHAPTPGLNARIIASLHRGSSVVLHRENIARANAGDGLDVAMLYGSWLSEGLLEPETQRVQSLLAVSLAQLMSGYQIRSMFGEARGPQIPYMRQSGVVRELAAFPELDLVWNVMTSADAFAQPMSRAVSVFAFEQPTLSLSDAEQMLLSSALSGATDVELAQSLNISIAAIKARWRSIFARFAVISSATDADERDGRGPQKRHRVLSYLRDHPEELRPFKARD